MKENQEKLIEIAKSFIGTPYKYGVKEEEIPKFLDCSSFTKEVYKQIELDIPRSTLLQAANAGKEIDLTNAPEAGDLLFFRGAKGHYDDKLFPRKEIYIGHVALYIGDEKVIHGAYLNGKVEEDLLENVIKQKGPVVMIKRIL
jgi:cell wall-associated NlpC family hydrolase